VVEKVRERLEVRKQKEEYSDVGGLNLKRLRNLEVRKQYQIKISYRFAALEYLNDSKGINRARENIKENIKTSAI